MILKLPIGALCLSSAETTFEEDASQSHALAVQENDLAYDQVSLVHGNAGPVAHCT